MLPLPVSSSQPRRVGLARPLPSFSVPNRSSALPARPASAFLPSLLLARARTTNLAVLILASACCFSLYLNLASFLSLHPPPLALLSSQPPSLPLTLRRTHPAPNGNFRLTRLVLVPGHAIYVGADPSLHDPLEPTQWILEPYQATHAASSISLFLSHIRTGISIAAADPSALLVYSGGQTRIQSNETTEAQSYSRLANLLGLHSQLSLDPRRTTTEDFALDSWTNLLYSVSRFKEFTGRYPTQITVVGHAIKAKRFKDLHRRALRWPENRFTYIGLDPSYSDQGQGAREDGLFQDGADFAALAEGERQVYLHFEKDLYGCHGSLIEKRKSRNPFRRFPAYRHTCPEIAHLLEWCPENGTDDYQGLLPWSSL